MNIHKAAANGAFWSTLENISGQALSFCIFIVLARLLEPDSYGLIALSMAFIALLVTLADMGLEQALIQIPTISNGEPGAAFLLSSVASALLAVLLLLLGPSLSVLLGEPQLDAILRWLAAIVLLRGLCAVPRGLMVREFRFRGLALRTILAIGGGGLVGIFLAVRGYGVWALVGQELAKSIISVITLWATARVKLSFVGSVASVEIMLRRSLHIMGIKLTRIVNGHADNLVIGSILGVATLGVYTIAFKVHRVATQVSLESLSSIGLPTFSRIRDDSKQLSETYLLAVRMSAAITLPIFVLLILTADKVVPLVLGQQWLASVPVLQALMFASCAYSVGAFNNPLLIAVGRSDIGFKFGLFNTVCNLIILLVTVHWGIVVVAAGFAVWAWVALPIGVLLCGRYALICPRELVLGLRGHLMGIAGLVLITLICQRFDTGLNPWLRLIMEGSLGVIAYLLIQWFVNKQPIPIRDDTERGSCF